MLYTNTSNRTYKTESKS